MSTLSRKTKDLLRKVIEERIDEVPNGKRVIIPKDTLESLIFDTYYFNDSNITLKLPVWTGSFLEKIDLSEVSFDDVYFGSYDEQLVMEELTFEERKKINEIMSCNRSVKLVYLKNTNAKIDFSKSFGAAFISKYGRCIQIYNCNLSGADLSNNTFEGTYIISNSDLSYSNLNIGKYSRINAKNSNLEGIDLSKLKIGVSSIVFDDGDGWGKNFKNVNLRNTKINFITDDDNIGNAYDTLEFEIENGNIDGCFIDGVSIYKLNEAKIKIINEINKSFDNEIYSDIDFGYKQYELDLRNN